MPELILAVAQTMPRPRDLHHNLARHLHLATRAADQGARLVVFPELSLTGYDRTLTTADAVPADDPRLDPMQALADARKIVIVVGAPLVSPAGLHIGALSFVPGHAVRRYLKHYLHPGEEGAFVPGAGGELLPVAGRRAGLAICAEITHAVHAQAASEAGANIYATSCFLTPAGYEADVLLLREAAVRHRMTVLMANYGAPVGGWEAAGRSGIWSERGTLLAEAPPAGEAMLVASIPGPH